MDLKNIEYEAVGWIQLAQEPEMGSCESGDTNRE
jgi:hypothetical protein